MPLLFRPDFVLAATLAAGLAASPVFAQESLQTPLPSTRPSTQQGGAGIDMPPATRPLRNPLTGIESSKRAHSVTKALLPLSEKLKNSVATVEEDGKELALATVVRSDGYLLTKASELESGYTYKLRMASGLVYDATVTAIADLHDLALLHINAANLQPVEWASAKDAQIGEIVFTPGPQRDPLAFGVVSVGVRPATGGAMGINFEGVETDTPDGVRIGSVLPNLPAEKAGLKADDIIQKINDESFTEREKLSEFLQTLSAGTEISVTVLRGKETIVFHVTLVSRSHLPGQPPQSDRSKMQNNMGSVLSRRNTEFAAVLQHDTVLMAYQQGSPLVDLDGKALGINIARAGRVETYTVPSDVIESILPDMIAGKYPKENPAITARIEREKKAVADAQRQVELAQRMKENRRRALAGLPPLSTRSPDKPSPATHAATQPTTRHTTAP